MLEDSYQVSRCQWCRGDELYERYHDQEWGVPVNDVTGLFERLALESMQAGLAWITVLRKREHMRARFFDFYKKVFNNDCFLLDLLYIYIYIYHCQQKQEC